MNIIKYSEKLLVWMHRNNKTMKDIADYLGLTRQRVSQKLRDNDFNDSDKFKIKLLGFKE